MFKAKLIDNTDYYKLRSKQTWLMFLPTIPIAFLSNFLLFPLWITALTLLGYIILTVFILKNQKILNAMTAQNIIEIDDNEIRIRARKGKTQEAFKVDDLEKITLQKEFSIPQENMKDLVDEYKGNTKKNYLIVHQESKKRKFDFEIESHYMIVQLNKVIDSWNRKGLKIEKV